MSASGINRKILHIDDDPQCTRMIDHLLLRKGYEVDVLNDPSRAMEEIVHHGYQVVLLDIDMPVLDGIQLLHRIKEYDGGILVIMLTGLVTLSNVMAAFRGGAEGCFFKPLDDVRSLTSAIDTAFAKIDHWWQALHNQTRQRRQAEAAVTNAVTAS